MCCLFSGLSPAYQLFFGTSISTGIRITEFNYTPGYFTEVKTVDLSFPGGTSPTQWYRLTSDNFLFDTGAKVLLGDNLGTSGDDTTTVTLNGGAGSDLLVTFGGSQTLNGGDGDDVLGTFGATGGTAGASGTDILNGGNGYDGLYLGNVAGLVGTRSTWAIQTREPKKLALAQIPHRSLFRVLKVFGGQRYPIA
jgi:Ca2+-binding RTX toxin-like protein